MKRPQGPTVEAARAKATALADARGPDGQLRPQDRASFIAHWTRVFLVMERDEFDAF